MKRKISLIILCVMLFEMVAQVFGGNIYAKAEEGSTVSTLNCLEYSIFSSSEEKDSLMNQALVNINGPVHSNSNLNWRGSQLTALSQIQTAKKFMNGFGSSNVKKIVEDAPIIQMRNISSTIKDKIIKTADIYDGNKKFDQNKLSIDKPVLVNGDLTITGNGVTANDVIYSTGTMTLNISAVFTGVNSKVIFCTENGDININTSDTTINGVLYAPNGKVKINGSRVVINGRIIAKEVELNGSILEVNSSDNDFDSINTAPIINAGDDKEISLSDKLELQGAASDDGILYEKLTINWKQIRGPSQSIIEDGTTLNPKVQFTEPGEYEFEVSAFDGRYTANDRIIINVLDNAVGKTYTSREDFEGGSLINIKTEDEGSIKINDETKPFNFIWVAVSSKGTVVKINTDTGEVVGEYLTSPSGQAKNPSRTTVDHKGNVWIANRDGNSVVKIGLKENGEWIDKNGNGVCDTSTGQGNILPWTNSGYADTNGGVSTAEDECIIQYVRTSSGGTRHVSVDEDNNVWVSGTGNRKFDLVDGETGEILRTEGSVKYGGYGGLIDSNGVIWSSNPLLRWDTSKSLDGPSGVNWTGYNTPSYGLAVDSKGYVWNTSHGNGEIRKFAPDGTLVGTYYQGDSYAQGCVVDNNDDIWIAHSLNRYTVGRMKNDGTYLGKISVPYGPTGVAVDANGFIWATCISGYIVKIDPNKGPLGSDGVTPLGEVVFTSEYMGGQLYNYSDMTGSTLTGMPQVGTWSAIFDSEKDDTEWGNASWNAEVFNDGSVEVLVSTSKDGKSFTNPVKVNNGDTFVSEQGRYAKVEVRLKRSSDGKSPIVKDVTLGSKSFNVEKPVNKKPEVKLESERTIEIGKPVEFIAEVKDDSLVSGNSLSYKWEVINADGDIIGESRKNIEDESTGEDSEDDNEIIEEVVINGDSNYKANITFNKLGEFTLRLIVSDGEFIEVAETIVTVEEVDRIKPDVKLEIAKKEIGLSEEVIIKVNATDNMLVTQLGLKINNEEVELDKNNSFKFSTDKVGTVSIHGYALDEAGNEGSDFDEINVIDNIGPDVTVTVESENPKPGDSVEIKVNAKDNVGLKSVVVTADGEEVLLDNENKYLIRIEDKDSVLINVVVTDVSGNKTIVEKELKVQDLEKPQLTLNIPKIEINLQEELVISLEAIDNRGIEELILNIDGDRVKLNDDNQYILVSNEPRVINIEAIAKDINGNETEVIKQVRVKDHIKPEVTINIDNEKPTYGDIVNIKVDATDNVKVSTLEVKVNGEVVNLDANNNYVHTVNSDMITIEAIAKDNEGNITELKKVIVVEDNIKPVAQIKVDKIAYFVGEELTGRVLSTDNIAVKSVEVMINGSKVLLGQNDTFIYKIISDEEITIEAKATDFAGNSIIEIKKIHPVKELIDPIVEINIDKEAVNPGEELIVNIVAKDNIDIKEKAITINNEPIMLNEDGSFLFKTDDIGTYVIEVIVVDYSGNETRLSKTIEVKDTIKPEVTIEVSNEIVKIGEEISLKVLAKDNNKITNVHMKINGVSVELTQDENSDYIYKFIADKGGIIKVEVSVVDDASNETIAIKEIRVIANQAAPFIELVNEESIVKITEPTEIIGSVKDDDLISYKLEYSPIGKDIYTLIGENNNEVENGVLGIIDPTLMQNGLYDVKLTAKDASGYIVSIKDTYQIDGDMKVGNFTLGFEDINIPIEGLPITVNRNYDSRDKISNDFGIGWSLGLSDIKVEVTTPIGEGWYQEQIGAGLATYYEIFETKKHRILITYPNGETDEFEVKLTPQAQKYSPIRFTEVAFKPIGDTKSELVAIGNNKCNVMGETIGGLGNLTLTNEDSIFTTYNPTKFELTTKHGTKYSIDKNTGVDKITYNNGEYVTITNDGIIHSSGKKVEFIRDEENGNRITSITDFAGNKVEYKYDEKGDLVEVINPKLNSTKFTYNNSHGLIDIFNANGVRVNRNEYDDSGRIIAHVDAEGNRTEYNFDTSTRQNIIKDRLGNIEIYSYDSKGNIESYTDKENKISRYIYDSNDNLKTEIDPLGNEFTYEYDLRDNLLSKADPYGNKVKGTYNKFGEVLTIIDVYDNAITNTYSENGLLQEIKDPYGNTKKITYKDSTLPETITNEIGDVVKYTYDDNGNPKTMTNEAGNVTTFVYDEEGNCKSKSIEITTFEGKEVVTILYTYDECGNVLTATDSKGKTVNYEYDSIDQLVAVVDKNNNRITYQYDMFGNLEKVIYPDNSFESFEYDVEKNNISSTDANGKTTYYDHDKMGRVTEIRYPNGLIVDYDYDVNGQVVGVIDSSGNNTTYVYDKAGRNTEIINALNQKTEFVYDKDKNIKKVIDAKSNVTEYQYDKLGRRDKVIFNEKIEISCVYDELSRVKEETNANGKVTKYEYDSVGNLTKVLDPLKNETNYKYNEIGKLVEEIDANGRSTKYEYDSVGRVIYRELPLGQKESYEYDNNGNTISKINFNNEVTGYEYNSDNRIVKKILNDKSTIEYEYDNNGQLKLISDSNGMTKFEYDSVGNLKVQAEPNGEKIEYDYDVRGNITLIKTTNTETTYSYDILGRLDTVKDNNIEVKYEYDEVGNIKKLSRSNGTQTVYEYDDYYRLTNLINKKDSGEIISSYGYEVDNIGFRTKVTDNEGRVVNYNYDDCGKLLKEEILESNNTQLTTYTYDSVGNRLTKLSDGQTIIYKYDENNRLELEDDIKYSYDNNGNLVKKESTEEIVDYKYDLSGKLSELEKKTSNGVEKETYSYNALGSRTQKATNRQVTNYLVDQNTEYSRVLEEKDDEGNLIVSYVYGHDLLAQNRSNNINFYYRDGLGSTTALTDISGNVTDTYRYDAFGNIIEKTGSTENNYLFTGEQLDSLSGQYYLRARYMDPTTGRFTSMDSYLGQIQDPTSLHKYLYANANPANYTDPSGNMSLSELMTVQGMQSILASISVNVTSLYVAMFTTPAGMVVMEISQEALELMMEGNVTLEGVGWSLFEVVVGLAGDETNWSSMKGKSRPKVDIPDIDVVEVNIPRSKYPETAKHIEDAQAAGQPEILTINRGGSKSNRKESLAGKDKVPGCDLDEYPPAMFEEGGFGASVRPINPSDNRGSGSSMGHQLRPYEDGTKIKFVITD